MRRPSPGTVIALVALFVALGGPAQAARLISGKEVKPSTLTGKHIKNRSLGTDDLSARANRSLRATAARSIRSGHLATGAVTTTKLAAGAVGTAGVADASLLSADLAAGSVGSEEVSDGQLGGRDVGSFAGVLALDFGAIDRGQCSWVDATVAALAATTPPRSIVDDAVVVTPPAQFPDDQLVLSAAPVAPAKLRVRVCNLNGVEDLDLPLMNFRYISFDF